MPPLAPQNRRGADPFLRELLHWALDGDGLTTRAERIAAGDVVVRACRACGGEFETRRCRGRYPQRCASCRA